jgi:hypothetical protein
VTSQVLLYNTIGRCAAYNVKFLAVKVDTHGRKPVGIYCGRSEGFSRKHLRCQPFHPPTPAVRSVIYAKSGIYYTHPM